MSTSESFSAIVWRLGEQSAVRKFSLRNPIFHKFAKVFFCQRLIPLYGSTRPIYSVDNVCTYDQCSALHLGPEIKLLVSTYPSSLLNLIVFDMNLSISVHVV